MPLNSVCVYCGSNTGGRPEYLSAAKAMGEAAARRGLTVVYGGGKVGLMGVMADAALAAGGEVIGVIPDFMALKEVAHDGLTRLDVVESMHARKARMAELSDGFIALPGGIGTMEELFEIWTWGQLGRHSKPCGLVDAAGYYGQLKGFLDRMAADGFVARDHHAMLAVSDEPDAVLDLFDRYSAPEADIRLKVDQT